MLLNNESRAEHFARITMDDVFTSAQADALLDMIQLIKNASPEARHFWREMLAMRGQLEKAGFNEPQCDRLLDLTTRAVQGEFNR